MLWAANDSKMAKAPHREQIEVLRELCELSAFSAV